ncbi:hypothetical protein V492_01565 [Pseudogymnoascus sp. VKM F-4246]|nr:hypothetical protein V492_01565 [Pseudogymnoascus sp. VKM F-4246]
MEGILDEIFDNVCEGTFFLPSKKADDSGADTILGLRRNYQKNASTGQGGKGSSTKCVPFWQNRFFGILWGQRLSHMRQNMGFVGGGVFRIVLDGCDITVPPKNAPVKRAPASNPILQMDGDLTMLSANIFANTTNSTGENAVIIDIAQADGGAGSYTFNYTLASGERITSGQIMDDSGEELILQRLDALAVGDSNSTTFTLDENHGLVYFLGWTNSTNVSMEYTVKEPPLSPATTSRSDPSATDNGGVASSTETSGAMSIHRCLLWACWTQGLLLGLRLL